MKLGRSKAGFKFTGGEMKRSTFGVLIALVACGSLSGCYRSEQTPAPSAPAQASSVALEPSVSTRSAPASASSSTIAAGKSFSAQLAMDARMLKLSVQLANKTFELRAVDKKLASDSEDAGLSDENHKQRSDAAAAYQGWRRQTTPAQLDAGKKLYSAWLTYADGLIACYLKCDPEVVDQGPYGVAWHQAQNEFEVDIQ